MEVTSANFKQRLPEILKAITSCDFIVIDTEFTGISKSVEDRGHNFDCDEERYQKLKFSVSTYLCVQVGITAFTWNSESKTYEFLSYNFYTYPGAVYGKTTSGFASNNVKFLIRNGYDFNKTFEHGIKYHRLNQLPSLQLNIEKMLENKLTFHSVRRLSLQEEKLRRDTLIKIYEWMQSDAKKLDVNIPSYEVKRKLYKEVADKTGVFKGMDIIFEFSKHKTEAQVRRGKNFKKEMIPATFEPAHIPTTMQEMLEKISAAESAKIKYKYEDLSPIEDQEESKEPAQEKEIKRIMVDEIGFSHVIAKCIAEKKPIIGHNLIYDIAYLYHQFVDELPHTYAEFCKGVTSCFPQIYDTKVVAREKKLDRFGLGQAFERSQKLEKDFELKIEDKSVGIDAEKSVEHQAAYDSQITGIFFLRLLRWLDGKPEARAIDLELIKNSKNLINRSPWEVFDLTQKTAIEPKRANTIWIKFKTKKHEAHALAQYFSYFGNVEVTIDSGHSAFIEFINYNNCIELEEGKLMERDAILEMMHEKYDEMLGVQSYRGEESNRYVCKIQL